jgi:hypothetical protein
VTNTTLVAADEMLRAVFQVLEVDERLIGQLNPL